MDDAMNPGIPVGPITNHVQLNGLFQTPHCPLKIPLRYSFRPTITNFIESALRLAFILDFLTWTAESSVTQLHWEPDHNILMNRSLLNKYVC